MKSLLVFLLLPALALAYPAPTGAVSDLAHVLSDSDVAAIRQELVDLEHRTTVEMAVVTVPSLEGQSVEAYTKGLANAWGVGKAGKNNGVVFLVAPAERKTRIMVGAGSRNRLSDAEAARIIQEIVLPEFRAGRLPAGIRRGSTAIVLQLLRGPVAAAPSQTVAQGVPAPQSVPATQAEAEPLFSGPVLAAVFVALFFVYGAVLLARRNALRGSLAEANVEEARQESQLKEAAALCSRLPASDPEIRLLSLKSASEHCRFRLAERSLRRQEMEASAAGTWSLLTVESLLSQLNKLRSDSKLSCDALHVAILEVQVEVRAKADFLAALGPDGTMSRLLTEAQAFARLHPTVSDILKDELPSLAEQVRLADQSAGSRAGGSWVDCSRQSDRVLSLLREWMLRAGEELRLQQEAKERMPALLLSLPDRLRQVSSEVSGSSKARELLSAANIQLQQARQGYTGVALGNMDLNDMVMTYLLLRSSEQNAVAAQETWKREREAAASSPSWFSSASDSSSGFGGGASDGGSSGGDSGGASGSW